MGNKRILSGNEKERRQHAPLVVPMPEGGVYLLESHHSARFRMPPGSWPFHKFCWVPVGSGKLVLQGERLGLEKGGFAFVPAETEHRFVDNPATPMTLVIACVAPEVMEGDAVSRKAFKAFRSAFPEDRSIGAKNAFHQVALQDCFRRMLREQAGRRSGWESMLRGYVQQLVVSFTRGASSGEWNSRRGWTGAESLEGLLEELDTRIYESISLGEAAERCGLSARRFSELFKQRTGMTFVEYLNRKRIEYAKERLLETGHVAYACYESGYQDLAYFYRVFRKYAGTTPKQFLAGED